MASDPGILSQIFARMSNTVNSQITAISKFTTKIHNLSNNIVQKSQEKFAEFVKILTAKPKSKRDYWKIAGVYFAKKFVVTFLFSIGALVYIYVNLIVPNLEGKLWYAKFSINSKKAQQFSGKAKIYDVDKKLIYKGELSSGIPNGFGEQWDIDGNLKHKGNFSMGKYDGSGEEFDPLGKLTYSGNFAGNVYEGTGQLVNSFGKVTYIGGFEKGMKSGRGTEYDPKSGIKKYYGEFANDKYEGKGIKYGSNGEDVIFEGNFKDGLYDGSGKKYEDNYLVYEGEFKSGKYSGSGIKYDKVSRGIIYKGNFDNNEYNGSGELYSTDSLKLEYKGEFQNGEMHGEGILYDKIGVPIFSGKFRNNSIDYMSYFGTKIDKVYEIFGKPKSISQIENKKIALYNSLDSALIFNIDSDGNYIFERVIVGNKNKFMGISKESYSDEKRNKLGKTFSFMEYPLKQYHKYALSILGIHLPNQYFNTEKYVYDKYFIRFFLNDDQSEFVAIEIGQI